jgi:hypothetical protein
VSSQVSLAYLGYRCVVDGKIAFAGLALPAVPALEHCKRPFSRSASKMGEPYSHVPNG